MTMVLSLSTNSCLLRKVALKSRLFRPVRRLDRGLAFLPLRIKVSIFSPWSILDLWRRRERRIIIFQSYQLRYRCVTSSPSYVLVNRNEKRVNTIDLIVLHVILTERGSRQECMLVLSVAWRTRDREVNHIWLRRLSRAIFSSRAHILHFRTQWIRKVRVGAKSFLRT